MDKRIRSPNYPAISLPDAIGKVTALYRSVHTHAAPREVVAKGMGYNSLNGASATAISALHKYGLLERVGDEVKVSERALSILHPHTPQEKAEAIRAAAGEPTLFAELADRFPGAMPNEDLLRNYLLRKGFAPGAVGQVISAYRETSEMVGGEERGYDSAQPFETKETQVLSPPLHKDAEVFLKHTISQEDGRQIARYDFEEGGFVRIVASPEIDTEEALSMVETMIELKRAEIARRKRRIVSQPGPSTDGGESNDE
ncbi:hypothetical protein [Bradyrhizobium sp. USDA 3364]